MSHNAYSHCLLYFSVMKVPVHEIRQKMEAILAAKGYGEQDAAFLTDMYLGGELRGHTSHGLAAFPGFVNQDFSGLEEPEVIKATDSTFFIDAKSNPGAIVGRRAADEAMKRAKDQIVGTALIKNMDSWLRPGAIAQYIAEKGYFTIVINDGGGASIAPPGGYDPVASTNPIAYGIPTADDPVVVDMATSKRAWGQVRLANKYGTELPPDTFYDDEGNVTRDPKKAHSVMPFGDYKGFALAFMIEMLCGSMLGMDSMFVVTDARGSNFGVRMLDRGGLILVIDPRQTTDMDTFKSKNSELISRIKATSKLAGHDEIRIPGEKAGRLEKEHLQSDEIDVPEEVWEEIRSLAE